MGGPASTNDPESHIEHAKEMSQVCYLVGDILVIEINCGKELCIDLCFMLYRMALLLISCFMDFSKFRLKVYLNLYIRIRLNSLWLLNEIE